MLPGMARSWLSRLNPFARPDEPAREVREELARLESRLAQLRSESVTPMQSPYIPLHELYDLWPGERRAYPRGYPDDRKHGQNWPIIRNEQDLREGRSFCRMIADTNPLVIGFAEHITNFVVGTGYKWTVGLKGQQDRMTPEERRHPAVVAAQQVLDEFCVLNAWGDSGEVVPKDHGDEDSTPQTELQGETWRSAMEDGEAFLRLFEGGAGTNGIPTIRKVNPECVYCPPGETTEGPWSFGIETDPDDRQTRLRYHVADPDSYPVDGEIVPASRMLHLKLNVKADVKRGISDFWPLQHDAQHIRKLQMNMVEVSSILAAIAYIRQHAPGVTGTQIRNMVDQTKSGTDYRTASWGDQFEGDRYKTYSRSEAGQVVDITNQMQYQAAPAIAGMPGFLQAMQAGLRGFGLRWGCPEFFSGDASNANFASTLVAGGPFERSAQRRQQIYKQFQGQLASRVLLMAVKAGRLSRDVLSLVSVKITTPAVAIANKSEDTQRRSTLYQAGVLSKRTWATEEGLDPDTELAQRKQEDAEAQAQQQPPGGGDMPPGAGAPVPTDQPPQGQPDAGGGDPLADLFAESASVLDADLARISEAVSQLVQKTITDKLGRKSKRMVRADQDAPTQRQPGAPEAGGDHSPMPFDEPATTAHVAGLPGLNDADRTGLVGAVKGIFAAGKKAVAVAKAVASTVYEEAKIWHTRLAAAGVTYEDALDNLDEMSNPLQAAGNRGVDHVANATGIPSASWIGLKLVPKIATFALLKAKSMLAGKKQTESLLWEADDREAVLAEFREAMRQAILRGLGVGEDEPADVQESVASEVPPELLAAILVAYNRGDMEAVGDLMDLADDPEALAELLSGEVSESVRTVQERMASRPGWTWNDQSKRWTKDEKKPKPERKTAPGQSPKEQLQARKVAAEPARQAARAAWGEAVSKGVTADQLPELAGHLQALTRDELREVARGLQKRVGGLKREVVDRLLAHVGAQPTTQGGGKEEPKEEPKAEPAKTEPIKDEPKAGSKEPWEMTTDEYAPVFQEPRKPSPIHRMFGNREHTPEEKAKHAALMKKYNADVKRIRKHNQDTTSKRYGPQSHDAIVAQALADGKPVPFDVVLGNTELLDKFFPNWDSDENANGYTGTAANGVRYVNGVPQKGEEEEPKPGAGEMATPATDRYKQLADYKNWDLTDGEYRSQLDEFLNGASDKEIRDFAAASGISSLAATAKRYSGADLKAAVRTHLMDARGIIGRSVDWAFDADVTPRQLAAHARLGDMDTVRKVAVAALAGGIRAKELGPKMAAAMGVDPPADLTSSSPNKRKRATAELADAIVAKFTGTAANGVRYVNGVPQKGEEEPAKGDSQSKVSADVVKAAYKTLSKELGGIPAEAKTLADIRLMADVIRGTASGDVKQLPFYRQIAGAAPDITDEEVFALVTGGKKASRPAVKKFDWEGHKSRPTPAGDPNTDLPSQSRPPITGDDLAAVTAYAGGDGEDIYERLNSAARSGRAVPADLKPVERGLQATFERLEAFAEPVTVYRGIRVPQAERTAFLDSYRAAVGGKPVVWPAYTSTTTRPGKTEQFGDIQFEIVASKGLDMSAFAREPNYELLLDKGGKYAVDSVDESDGRVLIRVRQILTPTSR